MLWHTKPYNALQCTESFLITTIDLKLVKLKNMGAKMESVPTYSYIRKPLCIYRVARMSQSFNDHPDFQPKQHLRKDMQHSVHIFCP